MKNIKRKAAVAKAIQVSSDWWDSKFKLPADLKNENITINPACRMIFLRDGGTAQLNDWIIKDELGVFVKTDSEFRRNYELEKPKSKKTDDG